MRLRTWRKAAELTQTELADQLDCTQAHVWKIEVGRKMPSAGMLAKIAAVTAQKVLRRDFRRHMKAVAVADAEAEAVCS